jgi:hypothetical protein
LLSLVWPTHGWFVRKGSIACVCSLLSVKPIEPNHPPDHENTLPPQSRINISMMVALRLLGSSINDCAKQTFHRHGQFQGVVIKTLHCG